MLPGCGSPTLESDLRQTDRVELVTTAPDVESNYSTLDPYDYDPETDEILPVSSASSPTNRYPQPNCVGDDYEIECSSNGNVRICNKQWCDGINDCPNGEDEAQCRAGE